VHVRDIAQLADLGEQLIDGIFGFLEIGLGAFVLLLRFGSALFGGAFLALRIGGMVARLPGALLRQGWRQLGALRMAFGVLPRRFGLGLLPADEDRAGR